MIPLYKACSPANEHVLADQIINLEHQLIAANSNDLAPNHPAPQQFEPQLPAQQPLHSNIMFEISSDRP